MKHVQQFNRWFFGKHYVRHTAEHTLSKPQFALLVVLLTLIVVGFVIWRTPTMVIVTSAAIVFYVLVMTLKAVLQIAANKYKSSSQEMVSAEDHDLPIYTLLVPLYKEANMLAGLRIALNRIHYPKEKLRVKLLIEERDMETRAALLEEPLDVWYEVVLVPDIKPYGKPKALNMGLAKEAMGLVTIYDAEDFPDPDQLLKAVTAFRSAGDDVACAQARLLFTNETQSWVSRMYFAEYVVHYEFVLPGLAKLGLIPPLGGTSNHFKVDVLYEIQFDSEQLPQGAKGVGAWDPWNVTEDAELAGALALHGYRVVLFDSVTGEEAAAKVKVAVTQRTRWLKGYLQTGLVYLRNPVQKMRTMGPLKWFLYILTVLGTPVSLLLNPIFWALTGIYFLAKSGSMGEASLPTMLFIEQLFPAPIFYTGILLFVGGNLLMFYQMVVACMHREGYGSVKYMLIVPIWWFLSSVSAYRALYELVLNIQVWHKTPHIRSDEVQEEIEQSTMVHAGVSRR